MKKIKIITLLFGLLGITIFLAACKTKDNTDNKTTTETTETKTETQITTTQETSSVAETSVNSNKLADYLSNHTDSKTYHLLNNVALNPDASTTMDEGVTYMFSNDDNGNRAIGNVIAYYTDVDGLDASDKEAFCISFVNSRFPELSEFIDTAETHDDGTYYGKIMKFDDYSITIMPDNSFKGVTVILAENE